MDERSTEETTGAGSAGGASGHLEPTMHTPPAALPSSVERRQRWCIEFSVDGDLRFISHHDTLRLFQRALARADLPVHYSQGFNPHAAVSIPLPRPVGLASDAEAVVIDFDGELSGEDLFSRFSAQMPTGLTVRAVRLMDRKEKLHPARVCYRLDAEGLAPPEIDRLIEDVLAAASVPIERKEAKTGRTRTLDMRPYIANIERRGSVIDLTLLVADTGTVRPAELAERLGMDARAAVARMRRIEVQWRNTSGQARESHDRTTEGNGQNPQEDDTQA